MAQSKTKRLLLTCKVKVSYSTKETAEAAAIEIHKDNKNGYPHLLLAYKCSICGEWKLTRKALKLKSQIH